MHAKTYLGLALLLLVIVFTLQNTDVVTVHFLFWKLVVSRALMIFIVLVTGILVGLALAGLARHRHRD